jgi:hypothetical protein
MQDIYLCKECQLLGCDTLWPIITDVLEEPIAFIISLVSLAEM